MFRVSLWCVVVIWVKANLNRVVYIIYAYDEAEEEDYEGKAGAEEARVGNDSGT